jgi:hypothetical protein
LPQEDALRDEGCKDRSFVPLPCDLSLEELVLQGSFYGHLAEDFDLSFARDMVRPLYARGGWSSVDPVVLLKLQLVMFFAAIRS